MARELILASASMARRNLLQMSGIKFSVRPSTIDEDIYKTMDKPAHTIARALAAAKALQVSAQFSDSLIIGGDQTLDLQGRLINKSSNRLQAKQQLQALQGRSHELHSAVCLAHNGAILWEMVQSVQLTMRTMGDEMIDQYLCACDDTILGSVGIYQLEGLGVQLFEKIEGDYFAILGLPLLPLLGALAKYDDTLNWSQHGILRSQ